ncbi:SUF system NifU family Fe-S cluster assembly protein [Lactiplantibacillus garii]|uniref:SUF system NifU family Fe-S cluster assembly protein n=1 Tax=Lactiplantibacillus garii TaxID=2306423 RepID=A0A3R8QSQ5_9LACO|nr:SUF system NifU family Fe-S cluster assembly protein [Lactiplantibacillus garii]RRK11315.1 SUF system NifU family Fe-S cluster assembly protein [Lactiplantibacillus garii]
MSLLRLKALYQTVILEHAQAPHHFGTVPDAQTVTLHNPTCGDEINVQMVIQDHQIKQIAFTGSGCTISQASASIMTDVLAGQPVAVAQQRIANFSTLITGDTLTADEQHALGDAAVLATVAEFPTRIKCATLAWHAADQLLTMGDDADGRTK